LVASDIERGVGQQVQGYTLFPHAMAFEKLGAEAESVVGEFTRSLAQEARDVGIHITFGPVADVNTNPRNPIIATRAFSENAERAASLTRAYVMAAEAAGLRNYGETFSRPWRHSPGLARLASQRRAVIRRAPSV
jgi:beta-glucosidase-like glycosyl hydrolase